MASVEDVDLCALVGKYQHLKESAVSSFYPVGISHRLLKIFERYYTMWHYIKGDINLNSG
jgi:hypothetical protein